MIITHTDNIPPAPKTPASVGASCIQNIAANVPRRSPVVVSDANVRDDNSALGSITKSQSSTHSDNNKTVSNTQSNRRSAYALKNTSAKLLPTERVAHCLNHRVTHERGVDVRLNKSNGRAAYGNLMRCNSVWVCPCCSARILAQRGSEVEQGVKSWTEAGGSVWMLTLTHSHQRTDNLAVKMKLLQKALSRFFGDRAMKSVFEQFGKTGQITTLETTYSEANGWHPHHHILMFSAMSPDQFLNDVVSVTYDERGYIEYVTPHREKRLIKQGRIDDIKTVSFEHFIKSYWVRICDAVGLGTPSVKRGATIQNAGSVKSYLTKFKTAQELTNAQAKRGKNGSRNQWEILADAHNGCKRSGELWQIYAAAFKGSRQLFWSRGLKDLLLIGEVADDEIEELALAGVDDEIVTVIELAVEDWGYVRRKNWRAELLEIVENDYRDGTKNLDIFVYSIKRLREIERAEWARREQERIANLVPPHWFNDVPSAAGF